MSAANLLVDRVRVRLQIIEGTTMTRHSVPAGETPHTFYDIHLLTPRCILTYYTTRTAISAHLQWPEYSAAVFSKKKPAVASILVACDTNPEAKIRKIPQTTPVALIQRTWHHCALIKYPIHGTSLL